MKSKTYIFLVSAIAAVFLGVTVPHRINTFMGQSAAIRLLERRADLFRENMQFYEELDTLLLYFDERYILQPPGSMGTVLSDVRGMLNNRGLQEQEFRASEQAFHYVDGQPVSQMRAAIAADGCYLDINSFLRDLAGHYRYLHLERINISKETEIPRLSLTFSVYGKVN